jgi:uncharacterized membrane protein
MRARSGAPSTGSTLRRLEQEKRRLEAKDTRQHKTTLGQRLADRIAQFGGSWAFIAGFLVFLSLWMALNVIGIVRAWDPYPFILLNLCLSTLAALQAPLILMSQNRQADRDRERDEIDFRRDRLDLEVDTAAAHRIQELCERVARIERHVGASRAGKAGALRKRATSRSAPGSARSPPSRPRAASRRPLARSSP